MTALMDVLIDIRNAVTKAVADPVITALWLDVHGVNLGTARASQLPCPGSRVDRLFFDKAFFLKTATPGNRMVSMRLSEPDESMQEAAGKFLFDAAVARVGCLW